MDYFFLFLLLVNSSCLVLLVFKEPIFGSVELQLYLFSILLISILPLFSASALRLNFLFIFFFLKILDIFVLPYYNNFKLIQHNDLYTLQMISINIHNHSYNFSYEN